MGRWGPQWVLALIRPWGWPAGWLREVGCMGPFPANTGGSSAVSCPCSAGLRGGISFLREASPHSQSDPGARPFAGVLSERPMTEQALGREDAPAPGALVAGGVVAQDRWPVEEAWPVAVRALPGHLPGCRSPGLWVGQLLGRGITCYGARGAIATLDLVLPSLHGSICSVFCLTYLFRIQDRL